LASVSTLVVACLAPMIVDPPNVSRHSRVRDIGLDYFITTLVTTFIDLGVHCFAESQVEAVLRILR